MRKLIEAVLAQQNSDHVPSQRAANKFIDDLIAAVFPLLVDGNKKIDPLRLEARLLELKIDLAEILKAAGVSESEKFSENFFKDLELIHSDLLLDAQAMFVGDPAAKSITEVIVCYPGFYAISVYRIAHYFWTKNIQLFARMLTEYAHKQTGIDIHPAAKIGKYLCIDHGTGIVIGETTEIHDNVRIYQGVTLGGLVIDKSMEGVKRHPTIESNVIIYANATILGGKTVVGKDSIVGGNVWITQSIPEGSIVYHESNAHFSKRKL